MGELLLAVMGKIGELSLKLEGQKAKTSFEITRRDPAGHFKEKRAAGVVLIGKKKHDQLNITEVQLRQAQFIKNHPDIVKEKHKDHVRSQKGDDAVKHRHEKLNMTRS